MESSYTLADRAGFYTRTFPIWPALRADNRWLDGIWVLGNNYKGSGYYGAYPPGYIKRVMALFPDATSVMHLFSGSLARDTSACYFDIEDGDAHQLSQYCPPDSHDLILADPPYSDEDALHYGTPMVNRNTVLKECAVVLEPGGFVVWLDQVLPMFSKQYLQLVGLIGIVRSTNHRFRVASIFQKP